MVRFARTYYPMLLLCLCMSISARAQNMVSSADTAYINTLHRTTDKILNPDSAIIGFENVFRLSVRKNYADGAFMALIVMAIKYYEKEDYDSLRLTCKRALPWAEKSDIKDAVAWCYNNISDAYMVEGEYTRALDYLYISLEELNKRTSEPTHVTANIYNNYATIYRRLGRIPEARTYYAKAIDVGEKGKLYFQLANTNADLGDYFLSIGETDSAVECFNKIMNIGRLIDKKDLQATAYASLGKAYIQRKNYGRALECLQQSIAIATNHYEYIVTDASLALTDLWTQTGAYRQAIALGNKIAAGNIKYRLSGNYMKAYTRLAEVYRLVGDNANALRCMDTLMVLKDQVTALEKQKAINHAEVKYKAAEGERKIAENKLVIAGQQDKIFRKNIFIAGIAAGIVVLLLLFVLLYINTRNRQQLHKQQVQALESDKTISVLKGMVEATDKERARIARDLHDGVGGMLSAAMIRIRGLKKHNAALGGSDEFRQAIELLSKTGDEVRKTAHNLMPDNLVKQKLSEALADHCNAISTDVLPVTLHCQGDVDELPEDIKLNIYRITQELLKNALKYAQATSIIVQLQVIGGLLGLTVEDDGAGFDVKDKRSGIGLENIQTRVDSMGGTLDLDSRPGKGTTVYIEVELPIVPPFTEKPVASEN